MAQLSVKIVTPQSTLAQANAHMVVVPGCEGEFGFLAGHTPLLTNLKAGFITLYDETNKILEQIFVLSGLCQIHQDKCVILTEEEVNLKDTNTEKLEQKISSLQKELSNNINTAEPRIIDDLQTEIEAFQKLRSIII